MSDDIPAVCFLDDVAKALRTSRRTIERLRRHGCFPLPELPRIGSRPRWSGEVVRRFIASGEGGRRLRRVS